MMNKKLLSIIAVLTITSAIASAELVGSLHLPTGMDTGKVLQSTNGIPTRTSPGDANTRGTVAGTFSGQAGVLIGAGDYTGFGLKTYSGSTEIQQTDRYAGGVGGGYVWDFDLSGTVTNAWELNVDFERAGGTVRDAEWYISFTGLGRTLDTTDVTTLAPGSGIEALITDISKYVYLGNLGDGVVSGTNTWDLTEIIEAAQAEGAGLVRIVLKENSFKRNIKFLNDSGLIAASSTSGDTVYLPKFLVFDKFEDGTGEATNGVVYGDWKKIGAGPENIEYNVGGSGQLVIRDEIGPEGTNALHLGEYDGVQIQFEPTQLKSVGDFIDLSIDVTTFNDTSPGFPTNTLPGGLVMALSLTDSTVTTNGGYGFYGRPPNVLYSSLRIYDDPLAWPSTDLSNPGGNTSRKSLLEDTFTTWKLRIERIEGDQLTVTPSVDYQLFGSPAAFVSTNDICLNNAFDTLAIVVRGQDIGMRIDNVVIQSVVQFIELAPYDAWAEIYGPTATNKTANPDMDELSNWAEYIFGGDPTNGADIGVLPAFDAASSGYVYSVRNDTGLTVSVLTRNNLVFGDWVTNAGEVIVADDGGLTEYTNSVGTAADEQFFKLLVE
jgi:hypothetical protein